MADVTVRAVQTTNRAITGLGVTPDGVVLADGDYVLNVGQTSTVQNGVWIAKVGAWERPEEGMDYRAGFEVRVLEGNDNTLALWIQNNYGTIADTDSLTFQKESNGRPLQGSSGIEIVNNEIRLVSTGVEEGIYELATLSILEDGRVAFASPTGVAPTYIDGLTFKYLNASTFQVTPGDAFIPGANRVIRLPSTVTASRMTGADALTHVYLYETNGVGQIETTTTLPDPAYGYSARTKIGDSTRRYLGSLRNDASGNIIPFHFELLSPNLYRFSYSTLYSSQPILNAWTGPTTVQELYVGMETGITTRRYVGIDAMSAFVQWVTTGSDLKYIGWHPTPGVTPPIELPAASRGTAWVDLGNPPHFVWKLNTGTDTLTVGVLGYMGRR